MDQRESMLQLALADLESGKYTSIRQAAKAYDVPRSTLADRQHGKLPRSAAHEQQQRLTPTQEEFLTEWILEQDLQGCAPSHTRVREMAVRILRMNGDTGPLGKAWVQKYIQRNPRVKSVVGRPIEAARVKGAQPEQIQEFYDRVDRVRREKNIRPENTWNMDEAGTALGICTNSMVLGDSQKKRTYVQSPQDREWVSMVETVSATGGSTRPVAIFKGKTPQTTWFRHDEVPNWIYTASENGWTSNQIALAWLTDVFIPETKPSGDNEARLLILDGHGSHITTDFLWTCKQNNIYLVFLPPPFHPRATAA
jgi:hypothetical protein